VYIDTDNPGHPKPLSPGEIQVDRRNVRIGTGSQPVRLGQVQAPGKKVMNAVDWARGARLEQSTRAS
jgi:methionyl-tRNA formyltransferase